ncbi:cobalamin biosynthesis protein CbiX [Rhodoferax lacus]|uniref:Cobalamin biosynthesis protein CbiX n=1 Tax=Rhodoferax lacus TaxID=2184758 RepID=A0A3E1RGS9_9BURK|nr:CbiX/SirB N-terminal domain-containing protein [Rhodoferax lacus]RFO98587.1 cobalamin biosynthesis protein CbiX [Rhodoferax lacus]
MSIPQQRAVVLFAHGSRDPLWHKPMEAVAAQLLKGQPELAVRCAYLELSTPDLPTVCLELIALGITNISVVPMFLGVGRHAREDLPLLVQELRTQYPQVLFELKAAVGEDTRLIALLAQISAE